MSTIDGARAQLRRALERLVDATILERIAIAIAALVLALLIGSVIVLAAGFDPIEFNSVLLYGAVGNASNLALTLRQSTMLILAGVAVAIAFRAGVFNIGVQGQMVTGGFATTLVILGLAPHLPGGALGGVLLIVLSVLGGIVAGGLYGALPGLMKAYADANEVVTTIMLNFIAAGTIFYIVENFLRREGTSAPITAEFPSYVTFPSVLFGDSSFSVIGLGIAIVTVVVVYVFMQYTPFGYDLRTTGEQGRAAAFSGINPKRTTVTTMVLSGMIAGLTGAVFVIMVLGFYRDPRAIPTFGFDGIAVSLLAANNPLGVIPAGLLFGGLSAAKVVIDIQLNVSKELVDGIVGLIVLFVAMPEFFRMSYLRFGRRREEDTDPTGGED